MASEIGPMSADFFFSNLYSGPPRPEHFLLVGRAGRVSYIVSQDGHQPTRRIIMAGVDLDGADVQARAGRGSS